MTLSVTVLSNGVRRGSDDTSDVGDLRIVAEGQKVSTIQASISSEVIFRDYKMVFANVTAILKQETPPFKSFRQFFARFKSMRGSL